MLTTLASMLHFISFIEIMGQISFVFQSSHCSSQVSGNSLVIIWPSIPMALLSFPTSLTWFKGQSNIHRPGRRRKLPSLVDAQAAMFLFQWGRHCWTLVLTGPMCRHPFGGQALVDPDVCSACGFACAWFTELYSHLNLWPVFLMLQYHVRMAR